MDLVPPKSQFSTNLMHPILIIIKTFWEISLEIATYNFIIASKKEI